MNRPVNIISKGKQLEALGVTDYFAMARVTLNELEHFGIRQPYPLAKTPMTKTDPGDRDVKLLRETLQRAWDKPRSARADLYATYISHVIDGKVEGGTPPITIYMTEAGVLVDGTLVFGYTAMPIAIDGETQLEARFRLRKRNPITGDVPFAVAIYHGVAPEMATQILHDFNHYAKPISETKLGIRNSAGGMSRTIEAALAQVSGASLNTGSFGTKKHCASFTQAMSFVAGYAIGSDALDQKAATWFDALNMPGSNPIDSGCDAALSATFGLALNNPILRPVSALVWQVAGVLASEGHAPAMLKWQAGIDAYKDASLNVGAGTGKGGSKGSTAGRLAAVYVALKP